MMTSVPLVIGLSGLIAAAGIFALISVLLLQANPRTAQARLLIGALLVSVAWAGILAYAVWSVGSLGAWLPSLDALHVSVWVLFLSGMLARQPQTVRAASGLGWVLVACTLLLTGVVFVLGSPLSGISSVQSGSQATFFALLALPLLGFLALEQVFRNSSFEQRAVLRPLSLGVGTIFAIDLFVYSLAVLTGEVDSVLWLLRGLANAVAAPLILIAIKRQPDWGRELFVSRHVVFYTTSLMGAGLYLLATSVVGSLIVSRTGAWGPLLQLMFLVCAAGVFLYALFSSTTRRAFKVLIAKHFYRNRYDYREEFLRLIATLGGAEQEASLSERSVKALAGIIGSVRGELWLANKTKMAFEGYGALGMPRPTRTLERDEVLIRFLDETRWVIDTFEYEEDPEKYANAFQSDPNWLETPSIFVPLILQDQLIGVVRLDRPQLIGSLSFEDHDLLKTAGQQVAIFLAQEQAQGELSETRQFEAFSKLTAFLMHDLKNMIAQQDLVVGNARRFKHRPEFIDDAIGTIEASVTRMKNVLERLQGATTVEKTSRVVLHKLVDEVCSSCADRQPVPKFVSSDTQVRVSIEREKLSMAILHAVRNAQDATDAEGRIEVHLFVDADTVYIEVSDTGVGMDPEFIRDHLFKPFDSTKGVKGMGIGAYQIRETIRSAGGDVEVSSEPGNGTILRMKLPVAKMHSDAEKSVA